jgi:hypothetical protein
MAFAVAMVWDSKIDVDNKRGKFAMGVSSHVFEALDQTRRNHYSPDDEVNLPQEPNKEPNFE